MAAASRSEEFHIRNWHVEDGLPDGEITAIQQTPDGYLWVGTPKGLARFDGARFKVFKAAPTFPLLDTRITWLLTTSNGTLWVSAQNGSVVRRQGGRFEKMQLPAGFANNNEQNRTPGNWLWERRMHLIEGTESAPDEVLDSRTHLVEDAEGAVWWHVSDTAIARLHENRWTTFTASNGLPSGGVRQVNVDHEGHVWIEAGGKLHRFKNDAETFLQGESVSLGGPWPVFAPARQGGFWVAEPRGSWFQRGGQVRRYADGQWQNDPQPIPVIPLTSRSTVTCLMEDRSGRLWYGTAAGGVYFSEADGAWQRLKSRSPFSQGYISCLFQDVEENIWVGTVGDGLYRVTLQPLTMHTLPPPLENAEINSTCVAHDGAIWMGTGGSGVLRWDRANGFNIFGAEQGLKNLHVCAILEDSQTNVWAGTSAGLYRLEAGRFTQVTGPPEISGWVKALYEDHENRLWIGSVAGLICREQDQFIVYHLKPDQNYCDIRSLAEDPSGKLWIGTIGQGLFELARSGSGKPRRVNEYPATDARSLYCDLEGTLWVGSWGEGIFYRHANSFNGFSTEDGLPSDRIQSIAGDADGRIWLSTDNGIAGITRTLIEHYERGRSPPLWCEHLSLEEGLANRGCSGSGQPVCSRTGDGRLFLPDYEGLAELDPLAVHPKLLIPVALVETVLADGKELTPGANGELRAPSNVRRFEFDCTAPNLALPQNLHYRYKLEGMDNRWVEAGVQGIAYYSQLKPAHYDFRVMVGGSDGEWHGTGAEVSLNVVPRLWERRWVRAVAGGILIGALGGGIARSQRRKLRLQVERLQMQQALETERRRIARDLHDELGARLTATALQGELAVQGEKIPEAAKSEISFMTRRVRQLISTVDEVVWTTDPENDSLKDLIAFLCDYLEQFLAPTGIRCRIEVAPDFPDVPLAAQARRNLLLAFKETLNNSVRHSEPKTVHLMIWLEGNRLKVRISDDGNGFVVSQARPGGKGLANIKSRLQLIHGDAEIASEPGKGTVVILSILLPTNGTNG
jgi:ligand-binding sensor domain-containing protein/signal transduction histidine kinase